MPISKKPRSKRAVKTSPKASALAALPDRRTMESFLARSPGAAVMMRQQKRRMLCTGHGSRTTPVPE